MKLENECNTSLGLWNNVKEPGKETREMVIRKSIGIIQTLIGENTKKSL